MKLQSLAIRAGDEEFQAFCMDSDIGRSILLGMADHFISRLRDKVSPRAWSALAMEAAGGAGVAKVVVDTLSDTPAAGVRGQGSVVEGLGDELARQMWEGRRDALVAEGHHAPLSCTDGNQRGSGCERCHRGVQDWDQLPAATAEELRQLAKTALVALNEKGLLP